MPFRNLLKNPIFYFFLAALVFVGLHVPILNIEPCFDDWPAIKTALYPIRDHGFVRGSVEILKTPTQDPYAPFWRPLSTLMIVMDGERLFLPQAVKLLCVIGIAVLLAMISLASGLRRETSWIVGAVFCLHQCMILGQEPDWWGDVFCTSVMLLQFGLALWVSQDRISRGPAIIISTAATVIGLLAKEAAVMAFFVPLLVAVFYWTKLKKDHRTTMSLMVASSLILVLVYLVFRASLGLEFTSAGEDNPYYRLRIGLNQLYSFVLAALALLSPVSTVLVATGDSIWRVLAVGWLVLAAGIVGGLALLRRSVMDWRKLALLAILFFSVQGPSLLQNHITEGNFSRSLPFGLMIVAMVVERNWLEISLRARWILGVIFTLWLGFSIHATIGKVEGIEIVHNRAKAFRSQVHKLMPEPPHRMVLFVAERTPKGYSCWGKPVWELARGGDLDGGLKFEYNDRSFEARLEMVKSLDSIPSLGLAPDFTIDRYGNVTRILADALPDTVRAVD
jgi:hypothetical protein